MTDPALDATSGILSRERLERLVAAGQVTRDGGEPIVVNADTIPLHVSDVVWLSAEGPAQLKKEVAGGGATLEPGELVTFTSQERVQLDSGLVGHIFPRGRLLAVGVVVVAAHIDGGFRGRLRIFAFNAGGATVRVPIGYEVARLEVARIIRPTRVPYQGVNAEVENVNPRADDLVTVWTTRALSPAWSDLLGRISVLEANDLRRQAQAARVKRWLAYALAGMAMLAVAAALLMSLLTPKNSDLHQGAVLVLTGLIVAGVLALAGLVMKRARSS